MARGGTVKIAVLGAGPVGLEAGLQLLRLGYAVTVYERGEVGEHLSQWGHVRLFSPFGWNATPLGLEAIAKENPKQPLPGAGDFLSGLEFRDQYLLPLSLTSPLCDSIRLKTEVLHIGRTGLLRTDPSTDPKRAAAPFRLLLRDDKGAERVEETQIIVDCTGTYRNHRWMGDGGIPAIGERQAEKQIAYALDDVLGSRKTHYANKSILVMGGGYSAATTVSQLATLAEANSATWVFWVAREAKSTPLPRIPGDPLKERDRLAARANSLATRGDGNVEFHANGSIQSVESLGGDKGFSVTARCGAKAMNWVVDRIIANVGHLPDRAMTEELHVEIHDRPPDTVRQPEPGYFVLGSKSHGRDSNFLLKKGHEQIKELVTLLGTKGTSRG
jgi:thioredoxin reductase